MSTLQDVRLPLPTIQPLSGPTLAPDESGRIVFTRHLWQRDMLDGRSREQSVLKKSRTATQLPAHPPISRRQSPEPAPLSKTPLTPGESPPFKTSRKRNLDAVEDEEKYLDSTHTTPQHSRVNSGDSLSHVCICQPDPKIPRPRNGTFSSSVRSFFANSP